MARMGMSLVTIAAATSLPYLPPMFPQGLG